MPGQRFQPAIRRDEGERDCGPADLAHSRGETKCPLDFLRRVLNLIACAFLLGIAFASPANAASLKTDELVELYAAIAVPISPTRWEVRIEGRIYESDTGGLWCAAARRTVHGLVTDGLGIPLNARESDTLERRAARLTTDGERNKRVRVAVGHSSKVAESSKSDSAGFFAVEAVIDESELDRWAYTLPDGVRQLSVALIPPRGAPRVVRSTISFWPKQGTSMVSDIDDTVKVTEINNHRAMLRRTFLESFEAVPGMAARYRSWRDFGTQLHWISNSPWQLRAPLAAFLEQAGFPDAHLTLRKLDLCTLKDLFELIGSDENPKEAAVERLVRGYPERHFVLVGDAGEEDPEVYGRIARRWPDTKFTIFIRRVGPRTSDTRFEQAFKELPNARWQVFDDPQALSLQIPAVSD